MQDYLYSVIGAMAIAIQLIINSKVMFGKKTGYAKKADRIYRFLMIAIFVYYITDALWGILAGLNWISLLFVDTTIYYIAMCSAIIFYYRYFVEYLEMKDWRGRLFTWFGTGFFVLEIVFLIINFFYPCFFWFDESDAYIAGPIRYAALWIQIAMFGLSSLVTLLDALRTTGRNKTRHLAIFSFSLIMLVAVIFQERFPLLPLYALGCLLGSCVLHVYVVGDEQVETANQLENYKQSILFDAIIILEANLSKDELYYGIWKDDKGDEVSLDQIIGLSVPCSYDTYIQEWNRRFVSNDDSIGFHDITDREFLLNEFGEGRTQVTFDYEAMKLSGEHVWLRRSITMTRNQDGDVIAYTNVKDITVSVERDVRENAYLHALATEYDSITIIEISNDEKQDDKVLVRGRLTDSFLELIDDETANEVFFSKRLNMLSRFVHPEDKERFYEETRREKVKQSIDKYRMHFVDFRIMKNKEDSIYYRLSFIPLMDEEGHITKAVTGLKNVDDEIRKEMRDRKELENARYVAEAANRAKTSFLFNMSHDIRTPMNAILGYTDVAIKHRDNQTRVDDSLKKIRTAGEHLLKLINGILEMSRIESDMLEIVDEPSDIRKLTEGVDNMSSSLAIPKSIDFKTEIGNIENPYVYIDELHINEVLINLTSNAIKYTREGGRVRFRVNQISPVADGSTVFRFEVEDDGIGMSEEFQEHLFEAFSREKTSTVSKQQGAGLGLSIVKRIVGLAGGTIRVNSKQNEGSTFTVDLPLRVMDEDAIRQYEEDNKPQEISRKEFSLENKKVLLVEDNEMNREIAMDILEDAGMIVDIAEDGEIAVMAVKEKGIDYYDLVLMDIQMPVMDGYEATKTIRALPDGDKVIIIALSANAFEEDIQKSLSIGMNAHVAKPIKENVLLETMMGLL